MLERVAFDEEIHAPDGSGGQVRDWVQRYGCRAKFIYSRGSEVVAAARLEGRAIYKVRIRQCAASRAIQPSWRMRDLRRGDLTKPLPGEEYNVREVDAITDRKWVYLVVESGVAT